MKGCKWSRVLRDRICIITDIYKGNGTDRRGVSNHGIEQLTGFSQEIIYRAVRFLGGTTQWRSCEQSGHIGFVQGSIT